MDVDGGIGLVVVCAVAAAAWVQLAGAILLGRFRARHAATSAPVETDGEWPGPLPARTPAELAVGDAEDARTYLLRALRTDDPDLRTATITTLGRLGARHEWAIDGLVEALVLGSDDAVRVATELDMLAPRPGPRLPPLLGHPNGVVRFYAVRLLARYPSLAARHATVMTTDHSPNVRAAALETLRVGASRGGTSLRTASARRPQPARSRACESYGIDDRAAHRRIVPRAAPRRPLVVGTRGRPRGSRRRRAGTSPVASRLRSRAATRRCGPGPRSSSRTSGLSTSWFEHDDVGQLRGLDAGGRPSARPRDPLLGCRTWSLVESA